MKRIGLVLVIGLAAAACEGNISRAPDFNPCALITDDGLRIADLASQRSTTLNRGRGFGYGGITVGGTTLWLSRDDARGEVNFGSLDLEKKQFRPLWRAMGATAIPDSDIVFFYQGDERGIPLLVSRSLRHSAQGATVKVWFQTADSLGVHTRADAMAPPVLAGKWLAVATERGLCLIELSSGDVLQTGIRDVVPLFWIAEEEILVARAAPGFNELREYKLGTKHCVRAWKLGLDATGAFYSRRLDAIIVSTLRPRPLLAEHYDLIALQRRTGRRVLLMRDVAIRGGVELDRTPSWFQR